MALSPLSTGFQSLPLLPTIKLGPSGAGSRVGGLVHTLGPCGSLQRPPTTSPVRLGVSPAAAPTPMGSFNQRFEALFPCAGALGCAVCFTPRCLSQFMYARIWGLRVLPTALPALFSATLSLALSDYLCANLEPQGLLVVRLPAPFVPHSVSLCPATATRVLSALVPVSTPPTGLDVGFFFISLVSDFLFDFLSVLVVQGGAVCLLMPPSWFSKNLLLFSPFPPVSWGH